MSPQIFKPPCIFGFEPWCSEDNPPIFRPFKPPECKEGETKCEGYDLYVCQNGKWVLKEKNSPSCGYTPPECNEGERKCVGYDLYECQNGKWVLIEQNSPSCGYTPPPSMKNITFNVVNKSEWYVGIAVMNGQEIEQAKIIKSGTVEFSFPAAGEYLFNFYLIPTQSTPLSSDYLIHTGFYKTDNTYTFEVPPADVEVYIQPWEITSHLYYKVYINGKDYGYFTNKEMKLYAGTYNWKVVIPSMTGTRIHSVYASYKDKPLTRKGTFNIAGVKPNTIFLRAVDEGTGALALNIYLHGMIKVQFGSKTYTFDNTTYIPQYGELYIIDIPEGDYNLKVFQDENLILDKSITIKKDKTVDMLNYTYGEKVEFMVV